MKSLKEYVTNKFKKDLKVLTETPTLGEVLNYGFSEGTNNLIKNVIRDQKLSIDDDFYSYIEKQSIRDEIQQEAMSYHTTLNKIDDSWSYTKVFSHSAIELIISENNITLNFNSKEVSHKEDVSEDYIFTTLRDYLIEVDLISFEENEFLNITYSNLKAIGPSADWNNRTWLHSSNEKRDIVIYENDNDEYEVLKVVYDHENEERDEEELFSSTSPRDALNFCNVYND
jgi:hypothetical protein